MTARDVLVPGNFAAFFTAVHWVAPFPWQERLLHHLADNGAWPGILDLPTSCGKTAALDIAIFHLALEASCGAHRRAPVRIAFVVDRRLIVDDAFTRAKRLETALAAPSSEIVGRVAAALCRFSGTNEPPLLARRLRGGLPREDDWARTPNQPTILCSTVDQVGSRLLFRGYGVSDRMKPVHAGLLGSDCLILLDEAHLAEPFRQTLAAVERLRSKQETSAPWQIALLSATPGEQPQTPFGLTDEDIRHPVLGRRLAAAKPAALVSIASQPGAAAEQRRVEALVDQATKTLCTLRRTLPNPAIGVIVNRVARARQVFARLNAEVVDAKVILLIGPARSVEREGLAAHDLQPIRTGVERALETPLIVVATQTVEAGVDIDFDGLVTEAAPLDALRQRFGRLNRSGRDLAPIAAIVALTEDIGSRADDPVYGDRIAKTWEALIAVAGGSPEPGVDFGIRGLPCELAASSQALSTEKKNAPILLPAYAELWSQTSPIPNADPEVSLFLHGPERSPASVQVIWRADVSGTDLEDLEGRERIAALLDLVPPRAAEAIEIPLWAAQAWLRQEAASLDRLSDIAERAPVETRGGRGSRVFRYAGSDEERRTGAVSANGLHNGDAIVVPAEYGGCDQWGWAPGSTDAVIDLAEGAAMLYAGRRFAVRVTAELIAQWHLRQQQESGADAASDSDTAPLAVAAVLGEHRDDSAAELLAAVLQLGSLPANLRARLELLQHRKGRLLERVFAYGDDGDGRPRGVVFLAPQGITAGHLSAQATPATEDDTLGSTPGYAQPLEEHSCEVRDQAIAFAHSCGLPPALAADIALAAWLHDAGKADPRFQAMLYGGDWFAVDDTKVLAKSAMRLTAASCGRAGLPDKWRHEALSVRLARQHVRFQEATDKELVLWLIGVHHGYGRPLFPHADPWDERDRDDLVNIDGSAAPLKSAPGPQSLAFSFDGRDWAQIFERLKRRYGPWELARMEAIIRLADHRASEAAAGGGREDAI
jgi:CRISPR-associated endonuclease/helicase Cas3